MIHFLFRFMPEPNLPPLKLVDQNLPSRNSNILNINDYRKNQPELPREIRSKLIESYDLSMDHAFRLLEDPDLLKYFKDVVDLQLKSSKSDNITRHAKMAAQMLFCDLVNIRSKWPNLKLNELYVKPVHIARAAQMRADREISSNLIKKALDLVMEVDKYQSANFTLDDIITEQGWMSSFRDQERIKMIVEEAIEDHTKLVRKYIRGNTKGFDTIVRNIFKKHGTDLDPNMVRSELKEQLEHMK